MPFAAVYTQDLNPLGHRLASTLVAAVPVLVLFYLLVGRRWVASGAGAAGGAVAILLAWLVYGMPVEMAGMSFLHGAWFGLLPIGWTVFGAMLLYNLTVETGQFAVIRRSIASLSGDARVQAVLIGFCFGAFMEGAAGAGSPVAICGAMLVGLGVPPLRAAVICLIANTSPVCYGGLGVPTLTLGHVTGINPDTLSVMAGHQLPLLSCIIPLYMVKTVCTWRQTLAVWPALAVGGGSFAVFQYLFATLHTLAVWPALAAYGGSFAVFKYLFAMLYTNPRMPVVWPLTDIGGGVFSLLTLAAFLKFVWKPKAEFKFPGGTAIADTAADVTLSGYTIFKAWSPFGVMAVCLACAGMLRQQEVQKGGPVDLLGVPSYFETDVPALHKQVERADRLQPIGVLPENRTESAVFKFPWATAPGTPVCIAAVISAVLLRAGPRTLANVLRTTARQMSVPIPTIGFMLGLSYVTKFAGMDATLGVAFAETGVFYPFFAALLGWVGVFLTGTDAGSNALFGSLQKITAGQIFDGGAFESSGLSRGQAEVLICNANSTGGVMGKMIDAQSICVATAGTNTRGTEADIFKAVFWHSALLACVVGGLTAAQAYLWPFTLMVPVP